MDMTEFHRQMRAAGARGRDQMLIEHLNLQRQEAALARNRALDQEAAAKMQFKERRPVARKSESARSDWRARMRALRGEADVD